MPKKNSPSLDLRGFLEELEAAAPEDILRISEPCSNRTSTLPA